MPATLNDLRYPVGRFDLKQDVPRERRAALIDSIAAAPARMREAVRGLNDEQLDTPYREGGWTVRQVVHHVPDSHMNAFIRFKLALTEDNPTIKPYEEAEWAKLSDVRDTPVETSLRLYESLQERWVVLLRNMTDEEFTRTFQHPELGQVRLDRILAMYEWHGRHHVGHITSLRQRTGW
jgi:uncharacterized damage-inducible protein DinB